MRLMRLMGPRQILFAPLLLAAVALCGCSAITTAQRAELRTAAEEALAAASDLDSVEWAAAPETRKALADVRENLEGFDELARDRTSLREVSQSLSAGVNTVHGAILRQDLELAPGTETDLFLRYLDCRQECEIKKQECWTIKGNVIVNYPCGFRLSTCRWTCVWKYGSPSNDN